ncbi:MAG: alpha-isopropylmalate synthase regulatory domain-containing protein, partial [Pseudomonadota bacterium]
TESEARVRVRVGNEEMHTVADGNGPVNALDRALRKALEPIYPALTDMCLVDYRVRILKASDASGAMPRVQIDSMNGDGTRWSTVGVSTNIIEASFNALDDSFTYKLFHSGANGHAA